MRCTDDLCSSARVSSPGSLPLKHSSIRRATARSSPIASTTPRAGGCSFLRTGRPITAAAITRLPRRSAAAGRPRWCCPICADIICLGGVAATSIRPPADPTESEPIQELLIDQLRDILHAEKQLLKALPKMAKAARSSQLQTLLQAHLGETEGQVERLNEALKLLGAAARAKVCKGMACLIEEGEEVMSEGKKKDDAPADLALIGAAQPAFGEHPPCRRTAQIDGQAERGC